MLPPLTEVTAARALRRTLRPPRKMFLRCRGPRKDVPPKHVQANVSLPIPSYPSECHRGINQSWCCDLLLPQRHFPASTFDSFLRTQYWPCLKLGALVENIMSPRAPLTHFLCLPLVNSVSGPQLRSSLERFRAEILDSEVLRNLSRPDRVIRPLGTLHLTLGVMSLTEPEKLAQAVKLLQDIDVQSLMLPAESAKSDVDPNQPAQESVRQIPLMVNLRSLASMQMPSKASTLYSVPVDDTGRLQPFCQNVRRAFQTAGFIMQEDRPLLLHATVLNTVYARNARSKRPQGSSARHRGKLTFDACDLMERFEDFEFARDVPLDKIAIYKMGAKEILDAEGQVVGEEYETVAERAL